MKVIIKNRGLKKFLPAPKQPHHIFKPQTLIIFMPSKTSKKQSKQNSKNNQKEKNIEALKKKIIPILKSYKVTKAGIFGSFARGDNKKKSDVDILAEIDKKYDLLEVIRIKLMLEKAIKRKVDLVEYELI